MPRLFRHALLAFKRLPSAKLPSMSTAQDCSSSSPPLNLLCPRRGQDWLAFTVPDHAAYSRADIDRSMPVPTSEIFDEHGNPYHRRKNSDFVHLHGAVCMEFFVEPQIVTMTGPSRTIDRNCGAWWRKSLARRRIDLGCFASLLGATCCWTNPHTCTARASSLRPSSVMPVLLPRCVHQTRAPVVCAYPKKRFDQF